MSLETWIKDCIYFIIEMSVRTSMEQESHGPVLRLLITALTIIQKIFK